MSIVSYKDQPLALKDESPNRLKQFISFSDSRSVDNTTNTTNNSTTNTYTATTTDHGAVNQAFELAKQSNEAINQITSKILEDGRNDIKSILKYNDSQSREMKEGLLSFQRKFEQMLIRGYIGELKSILRLMPNEEIIKHISELIDSHQIELNNLNLENDKDTKISILEEEKKAQISRFRTDQINLAYKKLDSLRKKLDQRALEFGNLTIGNLAILLWYLYPIIGCWSSGKNDINSGNCNNHCL